MTLTSFSGAARPRPVATRSPQTTTFPLHALALAVCALAPWGATSAFAQTVQATPTANTAAKSISRLPEVTITGNPLGATDLVAPAEALTGAELLLRAQSTLGETLDGTPGVSSSYFGPNASRPIIRGLEGDRIRVLQNSGASVDASGLSHDHAVPADPISMERIEVLRGPGALLYGGSAVGGVVNVIDNRIPREPLFDDDGGVSGKLHLGVASGNAERTGAVLLEAGTDRYALHADMFSRSSGDVAVPVSLACSKPGSSSMANAICNSSAQTRGGAVGGAVFFENGRLGASFSTFHSDYGTVAEDEVTIGMQSSRANVEWDLDNLDGWFTGFKLRVGQSDYQHTEYEGATPGTVFKNSGTDLRLVARHASLKLGGHTVQGVVGVQSDDTRFSADGEEAFAPYSHTRSTAVFALEELRTPWGKLSWGARMESVDVESSGNPLVDRFVPARRNFNPASTALGAVWNLAAAWQLTSNLAYSERAPKDYELFANGPHIATNAYEVGDLNAGLEKSTNLDMGVKWKQGANNLALSAFINQFDNYLSLESTGQMRGDAMDLPEYLYTPTRARFAGLEASAAVRLLEVGQTLDLKLRADVVRASDTRTGQPLPRIAPVRLGASLLWAQGPWNARLDANHVTAQTDVPAQELPTGAYTLVNASLSYHQALPTASLMWFAKLENLGDTLAYSPTSILTQTAPGKSPLPGRTLKLGVQVAF